MSFNTLLVFAILLENKIYNLHLENPLSDYHLDNDPSDSNHHMIIWRMRILQTFIGCNHLRNCRNNFDSNIRIRSNNFDASTAKLYKSYAIDRCYAFLHNKSIIILNVWNWNLSPTAIFMFQVTDSSKMYFHFYIMMLVWVICMT